MTDILPALWPTVLTGIGATVVVDLWSILRERWLGVPALDFAMVGRWVGHLFRGRFFHRPIAATPPVAGERTLGWMTHYLIGITFAALLPAMFGSHWFCEPTIGPAELVGIGSVVAPFFIMQPALGAGIAASRTPRPAMVRMHSLVTHAIFGLGLYATGNVLRMLPVASFC
ncbi:DUF2938 domain-containing protein [Dyella japonica]|uniref:DUF2938 domain-containing protein n=1 Tax=Dyella japonica A8 TaxID=1217721 RepID=A0A075KBD0_9GAMM|nr:DUF2938 domain-containing protein [Dyella japonica]AIF49523.1 hypothetical protein HY57_20780 [Dyella japonica A8]